MTDRASVSVLLIEDDASMARLVRHLLELDGYSRIKHVWTAEQAVVAAAEADIILLDHQLPDVRGIELLPRLLGRPDPPSVIMVTGHGSESLAAAALMLPSVWVAIIGFRAAADGTTAVKTGHVEFEAKWEKVYGLLGDIPGRLVTRWQSDEKVYAMLIVLGLVWIFLAISGRRDED